MALSQADRERLVRQRFGGRARGLTPLASGEWSAAYALTLDGRDAVIRFGAHLEDFAKDEVMGRHARAGLPIPPVLEIGEADDGYYAVSLRVPGEPIDDLGGAAVQAVLPQLLHALAALQEVAIEGRQGFGLWRADGAAPDATWARYLLAVGEPSPRLPGWRERLDRHACAARAFDAGCARLAAMARGIGEHPGIVHADLLNRNVLVHGGRLSGVIDWGNALYGDPLYDVAWLQYWWPWYPAWRAVDLGAILSRHWLRHGGMPAQAEERLGCYRLHIGLQAIAYTAFRGRADDLARNAAQVLGDLR